MGELTTLPINGATLKAATSTGASSTVPMKPTGYFPVFKEGGPEQHAYTSIDELDFDMHMEISNEIYTLEKKLEDKNLSYKDRSKIKKQISVLRKELDEAESLANQMRIDYLKSCLNKKNLTTQEKQNVKTELARLQGEEPEDTDEPQPRVIDFKG